MQYHGGKARIGQYIAQAIVEETIKVGFIPIGYCEPFCGMLGVYRHIPDLFELHQLKLNNYVASDLSESLILMWIAAQKGWKPPTKLITREKFYKLKKSRASSALKGYLGHFYAFMGKYFVTFDNRKTQNEANRQSVKITNLGLKLKRVNFTAGDYKTQSDLKQFVIYLDEPYQEQSRYYQEGGQRQPSFDHEEFWQWCRTMSRENLLFISAYSAPDDFVEVFAMSAKVPTGRKMEKLFCVKPHLNHTSRIINPRVDLSHH